LPKTAALLLMRRALPQSGLGKACRSLLCQWNALVAQCDHRETRIDTNLLENAIRPSAMEEKNFLFIGLRAASDRSTIIYSIVVSCQRHSVDLRDYSRDVLSRLPTKTTRGAISQPRFSPPGSP
jgi:hypothetical protein